VWFLERYSEGSGREAGAWKSDYRGFDVANVNAMNRVIDQRPAPERRLMPASRLTSHASPPGDA